MNQATFTPETLTAISDVGTSFTRIDADRAFQLHAFMRVVGDAPTYENWELARTSWIQGYKVAKPAANDNACDVAWGRFIGALRTYIDEAGYEMTIPAKPKAETPAAEAMRAKRANPFADKPKAEIVETVAKLTESIKAAKPEEVGIHAAQLIKAQEALAKVAKAEKREADKVANADKNKRIQTITAFLKDASMDVVVLFEALTDATHESTADDVKAKAWALLADVAAKRMGDKPAESVKVPAKRKGKTS